MSTEMSLLMLTAVSIASIHTLAGPDHYIPFIVLSKSRNWSFTKTISWTIICGCGHVWSSVLLGLSGAAIGWTISKYKWMDTIRGGISGWAMIIFGVAYALWGFKKARNNFTHKHFDLSDDGQLYVYDHNHMTVSSTVEKHKVTPWVMFIIFLLGPCEPMIPLLYFPGAKSSLSGMFALITVYTLSTLIIMLVMVSAGFYGFAFFKSNKLETYMPALSGFTIFICGMGIVYLGW